MRYTTPSSSVPVSPACTCCIGCAALALPRGSMRPGAASAAPGTGTAIPARVATSKACNIPSRFRKNSTSNGTGRRNTRRSRRFWPTPTMSPTASISANTFGSTPASLPRASMKPPRVGESRPTAVTRCSPNSASWRSAACRRRTIRPSRGARTSRDRSITPANGRMKERTSPGFASASSAPARRRSSRSRSSPVRPPRLPCSSAPRPIRCRPGTRN